MKNLLLLLAITFSVMSCQKSLLDSEDIKFEDEIGRKSMSTLLTEGIDNVYVEYNYSDGAGGGYLSVTFTSTLDYGEFFTVSVNQPYAQSQIVPTGPGQTLTVTFFMGLLSSGTIVNANVSYPGGSASANCRVYNATVDPFNTDYRSTVLMTDPSLTIVTTVNPPYPAGDGWTWYTPTVSWTTYPGAAPPNESNIYVGLKFQNAPGICFKASRGMDSFIKSHSITFPSYNNQNNLCEQPFYIDFAWDRKPFDIDTVSPSRLTRVYR